MSKLIYVISRNRKSCKQSKNCLLNIAKKLSPSNIEPNRPIIYSGNNYSYVITNPVKTIKTNKSNILLGALFKNKDWENFDETDFDGNYAIFRLNSLKLQILTDALGTRTVWYYLDENQFIAATSQRAIIQYLGNFEFNKLTIPWMISSGSIGPNFSWDKRLKKIPADATASLNRETWEMEITKTPVSFNPCSQTKYKLKTKLKYSLQKTFKALSLDFSNWMISLSGGYDSRAIINLLEENGHDVEKLQTVTWGSEHYFQEEKSDVSIAKKIAETLHLNHSFYDTGIKTPKKNFEQIINLFLLNGEGRNDHIPAYMDGFNIWKTLFNKNVQGIIRGDEVFGYDKIYSEIIVKDFIGITMLSDFKNLSQYKYLKNLEQKLPAEYERLAGESLNTWKDRLFHLHRIPIIQSSLADLKYGYVEQINPFLSREIVYQVRTLPDKLRRNKKLFREIVQPLGPRIPYSDPSRSQVSFVQLLRRPDIVEEIKKKLHSEEAKVIFPEEFLTKVSENMKSSSTHLKKTSSPTSTLKKLVPTSLKKRLAQNRNFLMMDGNLLAFRVYIISKMNAILIADSKSL